jgi:hypothetical protein
MMLAGISIVLVDGTMTHCQDARSSLATEVDCVRDHVSFDDASSRAVLQHSVKEMIEAGKMKEEEWSRYNGKGRGKKPDNGQLSINHPKINFLGDKGHRVRGYAKKCFALAALSLRRRILVARSWMPNG